MMEDGNDEDPTFRMLLLRVEIQHANPDGWRETQSGMLYSRAHELEMVVWGRRDHWPKHSPSMKTSRPIIFMGPQLLSWLLGLLLLLMKLLSGSERILCLLKILDEIKWENIDRFKKCRYMKKNRRLSQMHYNHVYIQHDCDTHTHKCTCAASPYRTLLAFLYCCSSRWLPIEGFFVTWW